MAFSATQVRSIVSAATLSLALGGCALGHLASHKLGRRLPGLSAGQLALPGLAAPVNARRSSDGVWHLDAADEHAAMFVLGWLQARDRAFQLDLLRHLSQGRLTELLGDRMMGERSTLELDIQNRFLGFDDAARALWNAADADERTAMEAFAAGATAWLTAERLPLEHRLIGVDHIDAWTPHDSLTVFAFIMHGLASNANREVRRLLLACAAGVEAMERIWPTVIDPNVFTLPPEAWPARTYSVPPAVVPDLAARLPDLCPRTSPAPAPTTTARPAFIALTEGREASNNWVVAGAHTPSGLPLVSNDPHLPFMNPPIIWAYEVSTPARRSAGFTLPGLHRHVFGHNGRVAWGQTTHHMDRQDLYVLDVPPAQAATATTYMWQGRPRAFELHEASFRLRGGETVTRSVRFSVHGPVLQDMEWALAGRIPLTALTTTGVGAAADLRAASAMGRADNLQEFAAAITALDGDCSNWVIADDSGHIGYRTPCRLPIRHAHLGTFPAPGWDPTYLWDGFVDKADLPRLDDPARGFLASANTRVLPMDRSKVPMTGDPAPPERLRRIEARLQADLAAGTHGPSDAVELMTDLFVGRWPNVRETIGEALCRPASADSAALCGWDGHATSDSTEATQYVLLTHALLDAALADELPDGAQGWTWRYVQNFLQFETNVHRLFEEPATAAVWDDVRTAAQESRADTVRSAFTTALAEARSRWGDDPSAWIWGEVRPFAVRHAFSNGSGLVARLFDSPPLPGAGDAETIWKFHVPRADRSTMHATVGPVLRLVVDLADPWNAAYAVAGGQSGWPGTAYYGDALPDWRAGKMRPLTPPPSADDLVVRFVPRPTP